MNAAEPRQPPVIEPIVPGEELVELLASCGLPTADVYEDKPLAFFGCREDGRLIAVIGIESGEGIGLLRSLAVATDARGRGLAQRLLDFVEHVSAARGTSALYLLTDTAADWFRQRGYVDLAREQAPRAVRASAQFSRLCPAEADFLVKALDV